MEEVLVCPDCFEQVKCVRKGLYRCDSCDEYMDKKVCEVKEDGEL